MDGLDRPTSMSQVPERFNILSLSGGGYMGLYTAHILAHLEARSGRPLRESFDLIAGTSIGGILGIAVALGVPMARVAVHFEQSGPRIFSNRGAPRHFGHEMMDALRFVARAKYDNTELLKTITRICPEDLTMSKIPRRFLAPAVNLTLGQPHTFRTPHIPGHDKDNDLLVTDVALATSAAPTLFPLVEIDGHHFSDGGTYANAPDQIALHEAEILLGVPSDRINMLSIGTTTASYSFPPPAHSSFGIREWMQDRRMIRMMLATQQQHVLTIMSQRLQERYLRIDADQGRFAPILGLDIASEAARDALYRLAQGSIDQMQGCGAVDRFLGHDAVVAQHALE